MAMKREQQLEQMPRNRQPRVNARLLQQYVERTVRLTARVVQVS